MDRRRFLKNSAAVIGSALVWQLGGSLALGQIPDEDHTAMPLLKGAEGMDLSKPRVLGGTDTGNQYPHIAFGGTTLWAAWVFFEKDREVVKAISHTDGKWSEETVVTAADAKHGAHPWVAARGDQAVVVWAERQAFGEWQLKLRNLVAPGAAPVAASDGAGIHWHPKTAFDSKGRLWIVSEYKAPGGVFRIQARSYENGALGQPIFISPDGVGDCRRPSIAIDSKDRLWVAWDQADSAGGPDVFLAPVEADKVSAPVRISDHPAADLAPGIAVDAKDRVWIAWVSNRGEGDTWDIPRWYRLRCYADSKLYDAVGELPGKDLTKKGQDQSAEFPQVICAPDGKVIVTARPSHNFTVQWYGGAGWSPLYRLPEDGWGGRGQYLHAAFDAAGDLWVVRRDIRVNVLQKISGMAPNSGEPQLQPVAVAAAPALVNIHKRVTPAWEPLEKLEGIAEPLHQYFGDIHAHTWISDGMGDVDEFYKIRRDYYEDDFASLTDHDWFVGKGISPSEFEAIKEQTQHFNADGKFVTFFGQEYTTVRIPKGIGHKCIYSLNPEIPLFNHLDEETNTGKKLSAAVRKWNAIQIPHHTGWLGTDWADAEDDIQPLCEIISVHGRMEFMGNRPIPHRGGIRGNFVQDALAQGHKFGIIGGSDCHGLIWQHGVAYKRDPYRCGLACFLAPDLTRESLFDAMRKRRSYATTGIKPRIDFRVNNHLMGEEITATGPLEITVDVKAQHDLKWITIVKDNQDWYEYGGEGYLSRFTVKDDDATPGVHYYYLRVEFEQSAGPDFKGPEMAWTSPIWVTRA